MDEELKFDDDEIEVLDFSNDIPPKIDNKTPEEIEILDFDDEVKPLKENDIINKVTPQDKVEPVKIEVLTEEVTKQANENLKLNEQLINSIDEIDNKIEKHNKETNVSNRTLLTEDNDTTKNSELLNLNIDKTDTKENIEPKKKTKRKLKVRSIIAGILILGILISVIIALPKINEYVNEQARKEHESANNTPANDNFKSNIDIKEVLTKISEYKSYKYETTNDILTKDKNNNPLTIKTSYTYLFNETKFSVDINKIVSDFTYKSKDFYEKLDDVYNLYVNDITTDTYTKRITTDEEFNKLQNIYPNVINYLSNNYKINK